MDNNNEKSEHGFVKVPSNSNNVTVDKTKKKKSSSFKTVLISFISGLVGAALILGLCFYVPSFRNLLVSSDSDNSSKEKSTSIPTTEGNTLLATEIAVFE